MPTKLSSSVGDYPSCCSIVAAAKQYLLCVLVHLFLISRGVVIMSAFFC